LLTALPQSLCQAEHINLNKHLLRIINITGRFLRHFAPLGCPKVGSSCRAPASDNELLTLALYSAPRRRHKPADSLRFGNMASAEEEEVIADEPVADAADESGGGGKRRLLLIAAGALVVVLGAGVGGYFSGLLDGLLGGGAVEATDAQPVASPPVFYALPEILVSLNTGERRSTFLKANISLELAQADDQAHVERLLPRIIDYCHVYLRELRADEVKGSAGTFRLREELLRRISAAVAPIPVRDVLFNELFVQ
jgi:flagellar FliL protein